MLECIFFAKPLLSLQCEAIRRFSGEGNVKSTDSLLLRDRAQPRVLYIAEIEWFSYYSERDG